MAKRTMRARRTMRVSAVCRGEGTGYLAVQSAKNVENMRVEVRTATGTVVPSALFAVLVPSERAVLAPDGSFAWIVVFPLLDCACAVSLWRADDDVCLLRHTFSPRASKVASRLLTRRAPDVAGLMRGFEQRRGAGRSLLFIRDGLPADDGRVAWRMQAEFPTGDATLAPSLVVYDAAANKADAKVVLMEDHVVPFVRDDGMLVRLVTFSCLLPESLGNFHAVATLGDDVRLRAFACMNAPRAAGMLADARHRMEGAPANDWYEGWFANTRATDAELKRQREACEALSSDETPLISIVMPIFRPQPEFLRAALKSVLAQSYDRWELVAVNASGECPEVDEVLAEVRDERVCVLNIANRSIAENTNEGIEAAHGDYVAFFDHDDALEPDALWHFAKHIRANPEVDLLYCDEDHLAGEHVHAPAFKTFPNYGKLYTHNFVTHLLMVSRYVLEHTERTSKEVSGAQDYDLTLKAFEVARAIKHVPRVLYHWREHEGSTSGGGDQKPYAHVAGQRALEQHLGRRGIRARVEDGPLPYTYRVRYELPDPHPLVSIVIPTRDHADLLRTCVTSILERSTYPRYEVVLVENGSTQDETFALYEELSVDERVSVVRWKPGEQGFNYSALINFGVAHTTGELVVLLNNDTEVIEPSWMEEMAGCMMRPEVGAVGAKLLFYDGLIQHVGMVANPAGDNCHVCQNLTRDAFGAGYAALMPGDYAMVTGACTMTRRELFDALGGYDEELAVGFNDSDYCLRVREAGYATTMAAHALLYHREFSSRGREVTDKRLRARLVQEKARIMAKHPDFYAEGDPSLNPNLNGFSWYFDL